MKKTIIALLVVGAICMTVGGIGAFKNYAQAEKEITNTIDLTEKIKDQANNQNLVVKIDSSGSNRPTIVVTSSDDDQFHLNNRSYAVNYQPKINWEVTEKDKTTYVSLTHEQTKKKEPFLDFGFLDFGMEPIKLRVPKSYKTVTIETGTSTQQELVVNYLTLTDLTITNANSSTYLNGLTLNNLNVSSESGYIHVSSLHGENNLTLTNNSGEISLSDVSGKQIKVTNAQGGIHADNLVGITDLTTQNGLISLYHLAGEITATSTTGEINLNQAKVKDNVNLTSTSGMINFSLEAKVDNLTVNAVSQLGDIDLFGKSQTEYRVGNDGPTVTLKTTRGDIYMSSDDEQADSEQDLDNLTSDSL